MGFQVTTNTAALQVYNNLGAHQVASSQSLSKISSGLKASGGTDVASLGAATTLQINFQATQSAITDVQNAINTLRTADQIYAEAIAITPTLINVAPKVSNTVSPWNDPGRPTPITPPPPAPERHPEIVRHAQRNY